MNSIALAFTKIIISFVVAFLITLVGVPKILPVLHRLKFGQVEREEGLESHKKKNGTPTMGGIVFIVASILAVLISNPKNIMDPVVWLMIIAFGGMGVIGFVDDWLIVVKKTNKGLRPLHKFLAQSAVAVLFYVVTYFLMPNFSTIITVPLLNIQLEMGILYPVLIYFMFTATSNGVNLSDGLDGLATGLCMMAIAPFVIFALMQKTTAVSSFAMATIGALLGFMFYNYHPAKIFMGDVGSLSLGGLLAALAVITKHELLLIIVGGVFVIETLSVILQVISYKTTGKRIFKMAPIHHHFEMLGWSEQQVVFAFWFCGFLCGIVGCLIGVM